MSSESTPGREPIAIVEIRQRFCKLEYASTNGAGTCSAPNGGARCFNTFATCQVPDDYDDEDNVLPLRFTTPKTSPTRQYGTLIPSLVDYSTASGTIDIEEALGRREKVTFKFKDFPYHDGLVDPYRSARTYDPMERGTFWTKWLARNPYYNGWIVRIYEGYIGQGLGDMQQREYVLERIDGPDPAGTVTLTAKDVLKLADGDRGKAPRPSSGVLDGDLGDDPENDTTAKISPNNSETLGEYPPSGVVIIGDEMMRYERSVGSPTLTLERAIEGTEVESHEAGDTIQRVYTMRSPTGTPRSVSDVIYDLLTNYAGLSGDWIDKTAWDAEVDTWLVGFELTGYVVEPTGIADVVVQILKHSLSFMWWDAYDQQIKLKVIRPQTPSELDQIPLLNEREHFIANSFALKRKPEKRRSRVYVYYDIIDPTEDLEESSNYTRVRALIDGDAEREVEYGETRDEEIYAPYWDRGKRGAAVQLTARRLSRLHETPVWAEFTVDAKDRQIKIGDVIDVEHRFIVDPTGQAVTSRYQIIEREETEAGHRVRYKAREYQFIGADRYAVVMPNDAADYSATAPGDRIPGGFIAKDPDPNTGAPSEMPNGDAPYRIF